MSDKRLRDLAGDDVADAVIRGLASGRADFNRYCNDPVFHAATTWMVDALATARLTTADLHAAADMADAIVDERRAWEGFDYGPNADLGLSE